MVMIDSPFDTGGATSVSSTGIYKTSSSLYDSKIAQIDKYLAEQDRMLELLHPPTPPILTVSNYVAPTPTYTAPPPPPPPPPVKTATPDIIQFNDKQLLNEAFADILFEQIGGQELLSVARYDTVNGQNIVYQPIKNLGILQSDFNPNNLIKLQKTSQTYFNNFGINLFDKIPKVGNGQDGSNIYLDSSGNLVIEFINMFPEEEVDIEIMEDGTIYEVNI